MYPKNRCSSKNALSIVAAIWFIQFFTVTPFTYGSSVVLTNMALGGKFSTSLIGFTSSAYYAANMLFSAMASVIIRKKGLRFSVGLGCSIVLAAGMSVAFFGSCVSAYICAFFVIGAGTVLSSIISGPSLIDGWFTEGKSMAMAVLMTSGAVGGFAMPLISEYVVSSLGYRACWLFYGLLGICALLICVLFIKNPDSVKVQQQKSGSVLNDSARANGIVPFVKLKHIAVWSALFGSRIIYTGTVSYIVLFSMQKGLSSILAAASLSAFHAFGLLGRLFGGVGMPMSARKRISFSYLIVALGGFVLCSATTSAQIFAAVIIIGFFYSSTFTLVPIMIPECFGDKSFSASYGFCNTVSCAGGMLAPLIVSYISHASPHGFGAAFFAASIISVFCALLMYIARSSEKV